MARDSGGGEAVKLLITGSAGFIGSYAVKAAMARGLDVDSLDVRAQSENRRMDVRLLSRIEADVVLHLAGYASNAGFADRLADNYANNVMGTWNVLRLAQQAGARVLYASSSAVYGPNQHDIEYPHQITDCEYDPLRLDMLTSHYAKSKLMCELMAASFPNTLGLRIFNAYGPGDELKRHPSPISQMLAAKRAGTPWTCYGDGTQAKDFIHVADVVECIMRLIKSDATGIVNVGTGVATTFNELAELIDVPLEYKPVPDPASYQFFTRASTERLESIIGKYEFRSVGEGIEGLL